MKVWILLSNWSSGRKFESDVYASACDCHESAMKEFELCKEEAFESFRNCYDEDDIVFEDEGNYVEIQACEYSDCWTGEIYETEVVTLNS